MSDQPDFNVPQKPVTKNPIIFGVVVILVFIGGFLLWAVFSPLESAAVAPGQVVVSGNQRTIQHLEGGIVKKINVKEGSFVKKGDVLLVLDNTQPDIALTLRRNIVHELTAVKARLLAERDHKDKITFPERLLKVKDNPKVAEILRSQKSIFKANQESFDSNLKILKQRIEQLKEQIRGTKALLVSLNRQIVIMDKEERSMSSLAKRQLIEMSRYHEAQRRNAALHGQKGENEGKLASLQQKIGETKIEIATLEKKSRQETLTELRETQQKLAQAMEQEKSAEDILHRTVIRAPITGYVVGLKVHTIDGVVKPGEVIMNIVPSVEQLVIDARIDPNDIDVVHKGLKAKVQLTAFKLRTTPFLLGTVTRVSADALQDPKTGISFYVARVKIDPKELARLPASQKLYPGMPVQVMIITAKLTPWQYFLTPIRSSFDRAFREQ